MYHNCDEFRGIALNADFLSSLVATLYPLTNLSEEQIVQPPIDEIQLFAESICDATKATTYTSFLTIHPARKLVIDFFRDLIIDTMSTKIVPTPIESILAVIPTDTHPKRNQEFITELLKTILDHLLTNDAINDQTTASQTNAHLNTLLPNFFNFIDILVDKLWDGSYKREGKEIFDTLVKVLNNLRRKATPQSLSEQLINSLNRVLLYQLSRPCESLVDQVCMLEVLHKMTNLKALIFSQTNFQADFFACVTHCLLMLTLSEDPNADDGVYSNINMVGTQWYINAVSLGEDKVETEKQNSPNAKALLLGAAQRVWLDLYLSKKSVLEECLKVSLNSIGKNPTLDQLRPILAEVCVYKKIFFFQF